MAFSQPVVERGAKVIEQEHLSSNQYGLDLIAPETALVQTNKNLDFYGNPTTSTKFEAKTLQHPAKQLKNVLEDVLRSSNIDESYSFLNIGQLNSNLLSFQRFFLPGDPRRRILYAMKANPEKSVLETFIKKDIDGFDCASWQEIEKTVGLGMRPEGIYFNNPIQRRSHLEKAFEIGVNYVTIQSVSGLNRILDVSDQQNRKNIEVAVRVKIENSEAEISMSDGSGKYGCTLPEAVLLLRMLKKANLKCGLAMHLGSQNLSPSSFKTAIDLLAKLATDAGGISSINLGGGFPVSHKKGDKYLLDNYLSYINSALGHKHSGIFSSDNSEKRIIIEPGRGLVATSVDLLVPVLEIRSGNRIHFANGIFNSFSDHYIHDWEYQFDVYTHDGRPASKQLEDYKIFGETCDPKDMFKNTVKLPSNLQEGDFLWVKNAGAYMTSQRSDFNGLGQTKYVHYNNQLSRSKPTKYKLR